MTNFPLRVFSACKRQTVELELEQVANYHDKLEMLEKYFIRPQQKQNEGVEDAVEQSD